MQYNEKSNQLCRCQKLKNVRFYRGVSYVAVCLGIGGGLGWIWLENTAQAAVCFLPDCSKEMLEYQGDANIDTRYCRDEGYTYYEGGKCPQYYAEVGKCDRDANYLKCDAKTWCQQNGYNTSTCNVPQYVDNPCPSYGALYKGCKTDNDRACREAGYVKSCSPGRLYANSNRCPYDSSYGKCCTASPSTGCPTNYKVTCDPSRGSSGTDSCGYTCYRCCSDVCSKGSKNYSGAYAATTECGSTCRYCKDCTKGSRSYSGSYAETSECGTCYYCNDSCSSGAKSVSCDWDENKVRVAYTECGNSCYSCKYNTDCSVTSKSCTYGCASYNSCNKCTSCKSNPDCNVSSKSCTYGCASYNSCSKCTSCKSNPDCDVTSLSCTYGCASTNSCGKCTSCKSNSDCNVTSKSCEYGCASYNSCNKCTSCKSNPWKYVYKNCRNVTCWTCKHQQYCGDLYQTGYAPVYTCDNYCKNTETGEYKFICTLSGYGIFSAKAATKSECESNISSQNLKPPSGEIDHGSCDSSGSHSCSY